MNSILRFWSRQRNATLSPAEETRTWCAVELRYYARHLIIAAVDWLLARERPR